HTFPSSSQIPPTQLVYCSYSRLESPAYKGTRRASSQIPPTQLVDYSYSAYGARPNGTRRHPVPKSHQRSWWIIHTQPTGRGLTAHVVTPFPNPTNAVGGLFILSTREPGLQGHTSRQFPNPTNAVGGLFILGLHSPAERHTSSPRSQIPPTQLVDYSYSA